MKNDVEPTTAPNASVELCLRANHTITIRIIDTTAKNQAPCLWKNSSARSPKFFVSKNSQWKKTKIRKNPPPKRRTSAACSTVCLTYSIEERVALSTSRGVSPGRTAQIIIKGKTPLTTNTANRIPQKRKKRRALADIVDRTSALIIALSIEVMISKRDRPKMVKTMSRISIIRLDYNLSCV